MAKYPFESEKKPSKRAVKRVPRSLADLLRGVPVYVFVAMVSKSGLPTEDARDLCKAFKDLK